MCPWQCLLHTRAAEGNSWAAVQGHRCCASSDIRRQHLSHSFRRSPAGRGIHTRTHASVWLICNSTRPDRGAIQPSHARKLASNQLQQHVCDRRVTALHSRGRLSTGHASTDKGIKHNPGTGNEKWAGPTLVNEAMWRLHLKTTFLVQTHMISTITEPKQKNLLSNMEDSRVTIRWTTVQGEWATFSVILPVWR